MGLFDRFTKGKKPVKEVASAPRMHPALSQLAKIYDSIHIPYDLIEKNGEWNLIARLQTEAGNRHKVQFCCKNIDKNDITITTVIKTPFSCEDDIPNQLLVLMNEFNRQYRFLQFYFEPSGYVVLCYCLPECTANPGTTAREIAQFILMLSDDIHNELRKYA